MKAIMSFIPLKVLGCLTVFQCKFCETCFPSKKDEKENKLKPIDSNTGKFVEKCPYCKGEK